MSNTIYDFLGFKLINVNLKSLDQINIQLLKIGLRSYDFNFEHNIITMYPYVEVCGKNITNVFEYDCGFTINDADLIADFKNKKSNDSFISILFATVYPFIRENIYSITKDTRDTIILPTIDCRNVSLNNEIILKPDKVKQQ